MSRDKMYFQNDAEMCYTLDVHYAHMREHKIESMEVFLAIPENIEGVFWCSHYFAVGETGECGKACKAYEPRNRKSGICKHYGKTYMPSGKPKNLNLNDKNRYNTTGTSN